MDIFSVIIYFYNEIRKSFLLIFKVEARFREVHFITSIYFYYSVHKFRQTDILSSVRIVHAYHVVNSH